MNASSTILLLACMLASLHLTLGQSEAKVCEVNVDCNDHSACINGQCANPCVGACGDNAECTVIKHSAICLCPSNYTGNPLFRCTQFQPEVECQPNTCGDNIKCKVIDGVTKCSCLHGYIGDPLSGCRLECESDDDCGNQGCCRNFKCYRDNSCVRFTNYGIRVSNGKIDSQHPCEPDPCGYNEICRELNGNAFCECQYAPFDRLPESGCNSECATKFDCPKDETCINQKCVASCPGSCSPNDICFVFNHKAKCRPKNSRPECTSNHDCTSDKACDGYKCVDPCLDHCVENADCKIVNQQPTCGCKPGYFRGPFRGCYRDGTIVE